MSVSPERPAESLSLGLQAIHGAKRRPLAPRGQRHGKGETEKCRRHAKLVSADWRESGGVIQELLRLRLHIQTGILMRLVARNGGDALHEIEDAFRRPSFLRQHRVDHLACLGLREAATAQKFGAIPIVAWPDPLSGGLDAVDESRGC